MIWRTVPNKRTNLNQSSLSTMYSMCKSCFLVCLKDMHGWICFRFLLCFCYSFINKSHKKTKTISAVVLNTSPLLHITEEFGISWKLSIVRNVILSFITLLGLNRQGKTEHFCHKATFKQALDIVPASCIQGLQCRSTLPLTNNLMDWVFFFLQTSRHVVGSFGLQLN